MAAEPNDLISDIVNRLAANGYRLISGDEVFDALLQQAVESDDVRVSQFAVRLGMYVGQAAMGSMCEGKHPSETPLKVTPELLQSFQLPTNDSFTELTAHFGTTEAEMALMLREGYRLRAEARAEADFENKTRKHPPTD